MQNLKPKKFLGQHFLADENIARKIVKSLVAPPNACVVEIGPGMGVLTKYLRAQFEDFRVVEYDPDAVEYLREKFIEPPIQVVSGDFLKWNIASALDRPGYFIGNLPYNVTSPILFQLLENRKWVEGCVFMVQKEVADRICAVEGASVKERGILTILLDCYFEMRKGFKVSPSVFRPPPKVMSAVFSMVRRPNVDVPFEPLRTVVKAAFGQRRKTLRNSIKKLDMDLEAFPVEWLSLRAEALSTDQFVQLSRALRPQP
ncbi:MAG TPA: ribosomal RNA small subunit methyltransferase A [Bacteroidetes bacterium]|nr:ribosomal RNA small subunit methyltransferase A [Bacteroidota bacterium]